MQFLKTIIFNTLFFVWTILFLVLSFWTLFMTNAYCANHFKKYFKVVFILADKVLNLKVEVEGAEAIRKLESARTEFLVVSKHQSAMETFFYPYFFKEYPTFIHKKELLYIPLWGWYMAKMKMIAIDRSSGKKAINNMVSKAKEIAHLNRPIIIFPEGTRTLRGETNKYKSGFYSIYKELNLPIVPIALNTGDFWNKKEFIKKSGIVKIKILPIIESGLDKKEVMDKVENSIENACKKL